MKAATAIRVPRISGITILNIVILLILALCVSNKVSRDHEAQVQSAVRSSHRLLKAVAQKRELIRDERSTSASAALNKFE